MSDKLRARIYRNLLSEETEKLLEIWQNGTTDEWDEEVFEIIKEILFERMGYEPPKSIQTQALQILNNVDGYFQTGELDRALSECGLAIQMMPDLALAYYVRAKIYEKMGQSENAIIDYQAAIQLDPEMKDAWHNMKKIEEVFVEEFQRSVTKQHLDQALEYAYDDEAGKGLEECELARSTMPNIATAHNYLGMVLQELNQLESAIDSYLKAIQLNPRFYAARENLRNARIRLEEELYHQAALENDHDWQEEYDIGMELDDSQILEWAENGHFLPGWVYLDEKAFLLNGWAGHRTRPGRSGYDPLDLDFEQARMTGIVFRLLVTRKFRTHSPIYLIMMTALGLIFCSPLLLVTEFSQADMGSVWLIFLYIPYLIAGIALLINVFLSLRLKKSDEQDENGFEIF